MEADGARSNGSCYYSLLGVRKNASVADIRAAYRKLALVSPPCLHSSSLSHIIGSLFSFFVFLFYFLRLEVASGPLGEGSDGCRGGEEAISAYPGGVLRSFRQGKARDVRCGAIRSFGRRRSGIH